MERCTTLLFIKKSKVGDKLPLLIDLMLLKKFYNQIKKGVALTTPF